MLIAVGNLVSRMGNAVFDMVLAWWVIQTTGSSHYMGYILAASNLPIVVFGPFAGVFSDRFNKKWVLVITDMISGLVTLGIFAMVYNNIMNIYLLELGCFILGLCTSLFKPTMRSIVPQLVNKDNLFKANSLTNNLSELTKIVGPLIGGLLLLVPSIGIAGCMFLNSLSFIISALLQAVIAYKGTTQQKSLSTVFTSLKEGFAYIQQKAIIKHLLILSGSVNFFLVSYNVLLPLYVSKALNGTSNQYSYALTAEAIGGILIGMLFLLWKNTKLSPLTLSWFIILTGVSLGMIPFIQTSIWLMVCSFLQGLFLGAFNIMFYSYVQEMVEVEYMGRVFSIIYMIAVLVMPISYLVFGFLGDYFIRTIFIFSGIGTICCTLPMLLKKQGKSTPRVSENL